MSLRPKKKLVHEVAAAAAAASSRRDRWICFGICLGLALAVWMVYGQTLTHDFVNYDDDKYVYRNQTVTGNLTPDRVVATFGRFECNFYHPLTMISLMLDHHFHGLQPRGYHLTSILLHIASAIILFLALQQMTAAIWRSAFVAALFAVHPLGVESVAWVAERKEVLAGFFYMLALWLYARYVRSTSRRWQLATVAAFALGLLAKPTVVTLPLVLLLLDFWPLRRLRLSGRFPTWVTLRPLLVEKIPLFLLSAVVSLLTVLAEGEAITTGENLSLAARTANALVSYVIYLRQLFFPAGLSPFYPHPLGTLPVWKPALALAWLAGTTWTIFARRQRFPFLLTGWLWFLGVLVPMIGLVQVGAFAHADRHVYLPQIGFYLLAVWGVAAWSASSRPRQLAATLLAVCLLLALIGRAREQAGYWRDGETLWRRALACTTGNVLAHDNLGFCLLQAGRPVEARREFERAIEINPQGAVSHDGLGVALFTSGQTNEAMAHFQTAIACDPDYAQGHRNLGFALLQSGRAEESLAPFLAALKIRPDYLEVRNSLGAALMQIGRPREAASHLAKALEIQPDFAPAGANLAWILATCPDPSLRDGRRAVELAERASRLSQGQNPQIERTLAAAYAERGDFDQALATARRAVHMAETQNDPALVEALQTEISLYQAGRPCRN